MAKRVSGINQKRTEFWSVDNGKGGKRIVVKNAVRVRAGASGGNRPGTFHGATNFAPGSQVKGTIQA